jgi:hypothetical protein
VGLRGRIKRLERGANSEMVELVCPECGAEFKAAGDAALQFLVHEWIEDSKAASRPAATSPDILLRIAEHEHDPSLMINKATGKPWLGEFFAGTLRMPDDPEDLSDQPREPL